MNMRRLCRARMCRQAERMRWVLRLVLHAFSSGRVTRRQAVEGLGLRDYAAPLILLG